MKTNIINAILLISVIALNSCKSLEKMPSNSKSNDDDVYNTKAKAGDLSDYTEQYGYRQDNNDYYYDYPGFDYNLYNDYSPLFGFNWNNGLDLSLGLDFGYSPFGYRYGSYFDSGWGYGGYLYGSYPLYGGYGNARPYYNAGLPINSLGLSSLSKTSYTSLFQNRLLPGIQPGRNYFQRTRPYPGYNFHPLMQNRNYYNRPARPSNERRQPVYQPNIQRSNFGGSFGGGHVSGGGRPGRP